jgi:hypothetical protein
MNDSPGQFFRFIGSAIAPPYTTMLFIFFLPGNGLLKIALQRVAVSSELLFALGGCGKNAAVFNCNRVERRMHGMMAFVWSEFNGKSHWEASTIVFHEQSCSPPPNSLRFLISPRLAFEFLLPSRRIQF